MLPQMRKKLQIQAEETSETRVNTGITAALFCKTKLEQNGRGK